MTSSTRSNELGESASTRSATWRSVIDVMNFADLPNASDNELSSPDIVEQSTSPKQEEAIETVNDSSHNISCEISSKKSHRKEEEKDLSKEELEEPEIFPLYRSETSLAMRAPKVSIDINSPDSVNSDLSITRSDSFTKKSQCIGVKKRASKDENFVEAKSWIKRIITRRFDWATVRNPLKLDHDTQEQKKSKNHHFHGFRRGYTKKKRAESQYKYIEGEEADTFTSHAQTFDRFPAARGFASYFSSIRGSQKKPKDNGVLSPWSFGTEIGDYPSIQKATVASEKVQPSALRPALSLDYEKSTASGAQENPRGNHARANIREITGKLKSTLLGARRRHFGRRADITPLNHIHNSSSRAQTEMTPER